MTFRKILTGQIIGGSYYRPLDPEADKRAEVTGEDTRCANCHSTFMHHNNGRCPK